MDRRQTLHLGCHSDFSGRFILHYEIFGPPGLTVYSGQTGHPFRMKAATYSRAKRPVFRENPATLKSEAMLTIITFSYYRDRVSLFTSCHPQRFHSGCHRVREEDGVDPFDNVARHLKEIALVL